MTHLGLSRPHWKFWEILELLGVWIQGWQHYLLCQKKINQDKWNPCETTAAGVCMKVWYNPAVTSVTWVLCISHFVQEMGTKLLNTAKAEAILDIFLSSVKLH